MTRPQEDGWWTFTLGEIVPMYGEGETAEEAMADLANSVAVLWRDLEENKGRLSIHLETQRAFLETLRGALLHDELVARSAVLAAVPETDPPTG